MVDLHWVSLGPLNQVMREDFEVAINERMGTISKDAFKKGRTRIADVALIEIHLADGNYFVAAITLE